MPITALTNSSRGVVDSSGLTPTVNALVSERKPSNIWEKWVNFGLTDLSGFILDAEIYNSVPTDRYSIEIIRYQETTGRSFIGIRKIDQNNINSTRVCLWDDSNFTPPATANGRRVSTVYLTESNSSGISAKLTVNWEALNKVSPFWNGTYWYSNAFVYTDAEFSYSVRVAGAVPTAGGTHIDFTIEGSNARFTPSANYESDGIPDTLMVIFHGNGGDYTYKPTASFRAYCDANKISYCCIQGQDFTTAPYTSDASGWGGRTHYNRNVKLIRYVLDNFNVSAPIILAGQSMGGLVMGQLAYYKPFPVAFCLGVGSVPSLQYMWDNSTRQSPIRNAYGMDAGGADDANIADFILGRDWYGLGLCESSGSTVKLGMPRMVLYLGTGDGTATVEFGGIAKYNEIRDQIRGSGGYCITKDVGAVSHADDSIWDAFITDGIMLEEFGN